MFRPGWKGDEVCVMGGAGQRSRYPGRKAAARPTYCPRCVRQRRFPYSHGLGSAHPDRLHQPLIVSRPNLAAPTHLPIPLILRRLAWGDASSVSESATTWTSTTSCDGPARCRPMETGGGDGRRRAEGSVYDSRAVLRVAGQIVESVVCRRVEGRIVGAAWGGQALRYS